MMLAIMMFVMAMAMVMGIGDSAILAANLDYLPTFAKVD
jgi:hypothetical protein